MSLRLIRLDEVLERTAISRSELYNRIGDGRFPAPISLGPRLRAWSEQEVDAMISAMIREAPDDELRALVQALLASRKSA
ncbi:MAG TPA: AlpA family phage regulatory protein [Gammaproteobacteria bacterium]|nr:AlpA family phage regulatory protein [Gammaproteobacteria bacterium]